MTVLEAVVVRVPVLVAVFDRVLKGVGVPEVEGV